MIDREPARSNLTRYTRKALSYLPVGDISLSLDIGCGTGMPTIAIARETGGKVIGIDNDRSAIEKLEKKIKKEKLSSQVEARICDLNDIPFDDHSFDLVWAEGSIAFIGFEEGLKAWKRLITPSGYLVVHDELGDENWKKEKIDEEGYRLIHSFILQENIWWEEYYEGLNKEIGEHYLDGGLPIEGEALEIFKEIEMYRTSPERFRSIYFIMQRR